MPGEDPGAATLSVILDVAQRAANAFIDAIKTAFSTIAEIVKMTVYLSFRNRYLNNSKSQAKHRHGKQRLTSLRQYAEDRGIAVKTVDIGDKEAAHALDRELKALKIDYSYTHNNLGEYRLHYLAHNEVDVERAQAAALRTLYDRGDTSRDSISQDRFATHEMGTPTYFRTHEPLENLMQKADIQARDKNEIRDQIKDKKLTLDRPPVTNAARDMGEPVRFKTHEPLESLMKTAGLQAKDKNKIRDQVKDKKLTLDRPKSRVKTRDLEPTR